MVMQSIQRCIDTIRDGKDSQGRALSALRSFNTAIIRERGRDWLGVADELITQRCADMALENDEPKAALQWIDELRLAQTDLEALRSVLLRFAQGCGTFNTCFLAAGFGGWEDHYRTKAEGNVLEAKQLILGMKV